MSWNHQFEFQGPAKCKIGSFPFYLRLVGLFLWRKISMVKRINYSTKLWKLFTKNNDGVNFEAAQDHSGSPAKYTIKPPSNELWIIKKLTILISDSSTLDDGNLYGSGVTMTNGIGFEVVEPLETTVLPFTIKSNRDWLIFADNSAMINFTGLSVRNVTFSMDLGETDRAFTLDGSEEDSGEECSFLINDDLSSLSHQIFIARGEIQKI